MDYASAKVMEPNISEKQYIEKDDGNKYKSIAMRMLLRQITGKKASSNILVIGGAGFIGGHLVTRLIEEGHTVTILDNLSTSKSESINPQAEIQYGSACNIEEIFPIEVRKFDCVYHLGEFSRVELSYTKPALCIANHSQIVDVLQYCVKTDTPLIYSASSTLFTRDVQGVQQSPYAFSKARNLDLIEAYKKWYGLKYAIAFFYNVYGPNEIDEGPYATVIGKFIKQYRDNVPLTVTLPGTQRRNFTHVYDVVEGLVSILPQLGCDESTSNRTWKYHFGNTNSYSILQVAQMFGCPVVLEKEKRGNRSGGFMETSYDTYLIEWEAKIELPDYIESVKAGVVY